MTDTLEDDIEDALAAMVARSTVKVPPYPAVALKLTALVRRESYGLADVVPLVTSDPTLAADLLRCANSSVYARGVPITSVPQAITRLGAHAVVRLAVTSALGVTAAGDGPLQPLKRVAWQGSVASAVLCQELASLRKLDADEGFLAGLLHDYGQLIALAALDEIVAAMPEVAARPIAWWRAIVERVHVKLGLLLVTRWALPALFQDVIAQHHESARGRTGPHAPYVDLVAAADQVVSLMATRPRVDVLALESIGRLSERERHRVAEIIVGIPGVIASFEAEPPARPAASLVTVPPPSLAGGFRPIKVPVELRRGKRRVVYTMTGIAMGVWVMVGPEPLGGHSLIEVTIDCAPDPLTLWAQVWSCTPDGGGVRLECRPFAVSSAALSRLSALHRDASA